MKYLLFFSLFFQSAYAQIVINPHLREDLKKVVSAQVGPGQNAGAMIGIYDQGRVYFLSFGETVRGNGIAPDPSTLFEIGSISKTFTALLLADAIVKNQVALDTEIQSVVQFLRGQKSGSISLLELSTHTSGLPRLPCNLLMSSIEQPYLDYSEADLIQGLMDGVGSKDCLIGAHPSREIIYSNWGYMTLGYVLSQKLNASYAELLKTRISDTLGLSDTTIDLNADQMSRVAQGYDENGVPRELWRFQSRLGGAGAIRSSAMDMMKYMQSELDPDSSALAGAIKFSQSMSAQDDQYKMALGWFMTSGGNYFHNGMTGGFSSLMKFYPQKNFGIFYLSNASKELQCVIETVEGIPCSVK